MGAFPLAVEVLPFAVALTLKQLAQLGCKPQLRMYGEQPFVTDNGNYIADCKFGIITDVAGLNKTLHAIPGILETGLFVNEMVHDVIVGFADGSVVRETVSV